MRDMTINFKVVLIAGLLFIYIPILSIKKIVSLAGWPNLEAQLYFHLY